jgi:hypothetical protein
MSYYKITRFQKCDVLVGRDDLEPRGFDKNISEDEIISLAVKTGCTIITKNGKKGKWYLKGQGKTPEYLLPKIEKNIGKYRDGVYCILIAPVPLFDYNGAKHEMSCLYELQPLSLLQF